MRRRVMVLTVVLAVLLTVTALAATPRAVSIVPTLTFDGTTAKCEVTVAGNTADETLLATIKLMHGNEMIRTWYPSARGILDFEEYVDVTWGETYTLTVRVISDTTDSPWVSVSGTCE